MARRNGAADLDPPARPAGTPYDRRARAHRAQLARAEPRAAAGRHRGARAAALDAAAVVPGDRAARRRRQASSHRRRQERLRGLLVRRGGDLRRGRRRARAAVGARRAQGVPPARRRRHGDHGRRAVGHVPDLLPPARQAQRPQGRAVQTSIGVQWGIFIAFLLGGAARLRRLPHPRRARARARGRRRAAPAAQTVPAPAAADPPPERHRGRRSSPAAGARRTTTRSTASSPSTSPPSTARRRAVSARGRRSPQAERLRTTASRSAWDDRGIETPPTRLAIRCSARRALVAVVATLVGPGTARDAQAAPFAYVANEGGASVSQFDAAGGVLTPLSPPTVPAGSGPVGVAVSPDAGSLYVADASSNAVSQYDIGPDGTLAAPRVRRRSPPAVQRSRSRSAPTARASTLRTPARTRPRSTTSVLNGTTEPQDARDGRDGLGAAGRRCQSGWGERVRGQLRRRTRCRSTTSVAMGP